MTHSARNLFFVVLFGALSACGGGGGADSGGPVDVEVPGAEAVLPEDAGAAGRNLIPPSFVVVTPDTGTGTGAAWVVWPESLALNVLDENNVYDNDNQALSWPSAEGGMYSSRADCSGFVTRSLMKAFQFTPDDMKSWTGSIGPSSARYHDNIVAQNNFLRVTVASQIVRGDILAIKYLKKDEEDSGGTGHTMIAASTPSQRLQPSEPFVPGTIQYELRIIDSTKSPHGVGDTRKGTAPDGTDQDGVGFGTVRLYADATSGTIVGYTWSLSKHSDYYTATSPELDPRSLVVGRMTFTQ